MKVIFLLLQFLSRFNTVTMAYLSLLELVENISKFRRKLSFRISSFSYLVDPGEARDSITISLLLTKNRKTRACLQKFTFG